MEIVDLITPATVVANLKVPNKKLALIELTRRVAQAGLLSEQQILKVLTERERLGSTGIGNGVAIPHGKLAGIDRVIGLFAQLDRPIDFDAIDDRPVDLIFLLLAPENAGTEHLKGLALVSRLLRNQVICTKLRAADNATALYGLLSDQPATHAA